jgi:hypothetical protein
MGVHRRSARADILLAAAIDGRAGRGSPVLKAAIERHARVAGAGVDANNQIALNGPRFRDHRVPDIHVRIRVCQNGEGPSLYFSRLGMDHEGRPLANRHIAIFASCIWPRRN